MKNRIGNNDKNKWLDEVKGIKMKNAGIVRDKILNDKFMSTK